MCSLVLSGRVNGHNDRVLGSENSHEVIKQIRAGCKINEFCTVTYSSVYDPFSLAEDKLTVRKTSTFLRTWLMTRLLEDKWDVVLLQDIAP